MRVERAQERAESRCRRARTSRGSPLVTPDVVPREHATVARGVVGSWTDLGAEVTVLALAAETRHIVPSSAGHLRFYLALVAQSVVSLVQVVEDRGGGQEGIETFAFNVT